MRYKEIRTDVESLRSYVRLFEECFPRASHLTMEYLTWLYLENPGGGVVGFDAFDGDFLVGHYACVPTKLNVEGSLVDGLLSLNTAVHPLFQGRGLFTALAEETYKVAADKGFACVYGVANANSTPGFIRKLDFQNVAPLNAKLGVFDINIDKELCNRSVKFSREWSKELLQWRSNNPSNPVDIFTGVNNFSSVTAATDYKIIRAYAPFYPSSLSPSNVSRTRFGLRLFIGLFPKGVCSYQFYIDIPEKLKPSPLNLIYKNLGTSVDALDPDAIMLGFHDFDAY